MKRVFTPILFLLFATGAFAQTKVTRSAIKFQIKNLGIGIDGTIGGLQANVAFNPAQLSTSVIEASVDLNTIDTDNGLRDRSLKSDEFLDVPNFPKITMKATTFKHKSGNNYTGQFNVTIKGKTKTFDIPFTYVENGNTATLKGSFKLNRLDFGVGSSSMVLSNDVAVSLDVDITK